jgi:hypothetical protein
MTATILDRVTSVRITASDSTVRIGAAPTARADAPPVQYRRPLTHLPAKVDAAACLAVLERLDPDIEISSVAAAAKTLTLDLLDDALSCAESNTLSTSDRIRLKHACIQHGILSVGRKA